MNLIQQIAQSVIGRYQTIPTSFGPKPLVYADYTASGRSLSFIENYIAHSVLPWYANTHTETSFTGAQTTALREQARETIRNAVGAGDNDSIIFCGSGATTAINKLINIMDLRKPKSPAIDQRPVVFIGPYEHHSNELPWRESCADVVTIGLNAQGQINQRELDTQLSAYRDRKVKIGSFSAASNVTGIKSDIAGITGLLKSHGALAFWDYAAASPYVSINMANDSIDAMFISPHKFIGGPGTPGILVINNQLLTNPIPSIVGGGTVSYVTPEHHQYLPDPERREEGGTPAIVESIRAGLVFKLQQDVGTDVIEQREAQRVKAFLTAIDTIPNIEILGDRNASRLAIFSMRFKHQGKDLHYGFITALLNDLFGIQVRGGCSCAGPYGHNLLNMSPSYSARLEQAIQQPDNMVLRPGWVRLNINYFIGDDEFNYILAALKLVAEYGWQLLPFYALDNHTTVWRYQGQKGQLNSSFETIQWDNIATKTSTHQPAEPDFNALLNQGRKILLQSKDHLVTYSLSLTEVDEDLQWFVLPQDVNPPSYQKATN